jgi:hypothetical protein
MVISGCRLLAESQAKAVNQSTYMWPLLDNSLRKVVLLLGG